MKKIFKPIIFILLTVIVFFCGCIRKAEDLSLEQHIERVSALVEKRYINEDSEYTEYSVYPLYNEYDELGFFLIEFEPYGFVYIKINETDAVTPFSISMYTRDYREGDVWRRYTVEENISPIPTMETDYGTVEYRHRRWEVNENGEYIDYKNSHFKVANIKDEKLYLLQINSLLVGSSQSYIPAVKRGDKYLNLVSMQEMDYVAGMESKDQSVADISFIPKKNFDL